MRYGCTPWKSVMVDVVVLRKLGVYSACLFLFVKEQSSTIAIAWVYRKSLNTTKRPVYELENVFLYLLGTFCVDPRISYDRKCVKAYYTLSLYFRGMSTLH